jgi:hypothetical protein
MAARVAAIARVFMFLLLQRVTGFAGQLAIDAYKLYVVGDVIGPHE